MPTGLSTSNAAPVFEILRTVQSTTAPSKSILPAFKTRCRDAIRLSFISNTKVLSLESARRTPLPGSAQVACNRPVEQMLAPNRQVRAERAPYG